MGMGETHSAARAAGLISLAGGSALGTIGAVHIDFRFQDLEDLTC
jgi:hypothetical protein